MRDPAREIGLAAGDDKMVARIDHPRREHDVAQIKQILDRPRQRRIGLDQRHLLAMQHAPRLARVEQRPRSEEHTSELQSLMRNSYAVFCLKKKQETKYITQEHRP